MLRETHVVVGVAAGLAVARPGSLWATIPAVCAAACGAIISDVDADRSYAKREADTVLTIFGAAFLSLFLIEKFTHINISAHFMANNDYKIRILAVLALAAVILYGKEQKHRSFMHSVLAGAVLSACVMLATSKMLAVPFLAGFLSHLLLDLLNYRPLRLLWPLPFRFCLKVCASNKLVNKILFVGGSIAAVNLAAEFSGIHFWNFF